MGFRLDGKMQMPEFQFDSEEVRYSHRFQPFTNVSTPPYIPYSQYKVSAKRENTSAKKICYEKSNYGCV